MWGCGMKNPMPLDTTSSSPLWSDGIFIWFFPVALIFPKVCVSIWAWSGKIRFC